MRDEHVSQVGRLAPHFAVEVETARRNAALLQHSLKTNNIVSTKRLLKDVTLDDLHDEGRVADVHRELIGVPTEVR